MQTRIKLVSLGFLIGFLLVVGRLFFWQILKGAELSEQARRQYQFGQTLSAPRGRILAQDGSPLSDRSEAWLVYAALDELEESTNSIAEKLAPMFLEGEYESKDERYTALLSEIDRINSLLVRDDVVWIPLKQRITSDDKSAIEAMDIGGIGFEYNEDRSYPESSSAAHLLGFVGKNDEGLEQGYFGLEGYYDIMLSGKPGYLSRESDARGTPILPGELNEVSAIGGVDLVTHIDKSIQITIEKKLVDGLEKYGAVAGSIIVMDPSTGAIMGMSSYPSYDPAEYTDFGNEYFRNPVVSDSFEPGSIFKVLVMSAGLDSDAVEPDTKCGICDQPLKVAQYYIRTWNNEYREDATMQDVIVHSDNVGMAFVGQKLGADTLYDYLDKFGIGHTTDVDLQGEGTPSIREKGTWNIVDLATTSFGQGIAATPIQILRAIGSIANDGVLVTPQVVDRLEGEGWEEDVKPEIGEEVISKKTADEVTAMMVEAAKEGEAKWTHLRGFNIAGKTGTAQIPIAGHYDEDKTIASYIGFAPADDPKFIMLVTLREPSSSPWASETAAPLWYSIAKDLFLHFGIQPED